MIAVNSQTLERASSSPQSSGRQWLGMIFCLIAMNMCIVAITIYFATSDRSAGIEPDYYARALNYDQVILQRAANHRLGWTSTATLTALPDKKCAVLQVQLLDSEGKAVPAALMRAVAFSHLRSGERSSVQLQESETGYTATVPVPAGGQWRVRIAVTRGSDKYTSEQDVMLVLPAAVTRTLDTGAPE